MKAQIEQTELRAPFDGVIGLRQVSVGSYASPSTIVATLTKVVPLKVEFAVSERYAADIERGANLSFTLEGSLNTYQAQVYARESRIDPDTRTLTVRALYPNPAGAVMPGRYVSISLKRQELEDALAVPSVAIIPEMGKDKVFCYRNGKAEPTDNRDGRAHRGPGASGAGAGTGRHHHHLGHTAAAHGHGREHRPAGTAVVRPHTRKTHTP